MYLKTIGQNERIDNMTTKPELKPVGELQERINKLYTKYETEMLPKFLKICNDHDYDYWHMFDLLYGCCFALPCAAVNDNQDKFLKLCAAMGTIANICIWIDPSMESDMRNDVSKLQRQVHEYDAPWYHNVVDQIRIEC